MTMYRKKPVVIEAVQFREVSRLPCKYGDAVEYNSMEIAKFMGVEVLRGRTIPEDGNPSGRDVIEIETLEGIMRADVGDWIIRGVKGEYYPCKPDIFDATYEVAHESS